MKIHSNINSDMDLSIVILTWNSVNEISKCLDPLTTGTKDLSISHEIFIVDNGSTDGTADKIKGFEKQFPELIKPIFLKENKGTTYSRNLALKKSVGEYILILDSDVVIDWACINKLRETIVNDVSIGIVVPRLVYPDGKNQKSIDRFPTLITKLFRFFFLKLMEKTESHLSYTDGLIDTDYAISAVWLFSNEILNRVGYLDEKIFYAPEDVDYCLRIKKEGYRVVYYPGLQAIHHTQEISRGFRINKAKIEHIKGLIYFFIKHKYIFRRPKFKSHPNN